MKMQAHEGSEEREGDGEEPAADSQGGGGAEPITGNQRVRGKKQQHQRQRSDAKKHRKEHESELKRSTLTTIKDSVPPAEVEGGRMRRCKQPQPQTTPSRRQPQQAPSQQQLPQPLARRRQRRLPRSFTPPKEEAERGLRSLTRYLILPCVLIL